MLYTSSDPNAVYFRDNIRYFNGHFSFTTLGVSLDNKYTNMKSGVYTFRAHGQIYHNIFSFGPTQDGPKHVELYFYDDDPGLQHRFRRSPNLDRDVIQRLVDILKENPYSETFRNLGGVDDLEEYRIELNTDMRLDQRRYNVPISSEVAAIWVEGSELWEIGWHPEIPKNGVSLNEMLQSRRSGRQSLGSCTNSRLCVSIRDYYCYKFQMCRGVFNTVLYGKRLFQQYVVDMYIKVESSRLDYIKKHQKQIRANLYQGVVDSLQAGENHADAVGK